MLTSLFPAVMSKAEQLEQTEWRGEGRSLTWEVQAEEQQEAHQAFSTCHVCHFTSTTAQSALRVRSAGRHLYFPPVTVSCSGDTKLPSKERERSSCFALCQHLQIFSSFSLLLMTRLYFFFFFVSLLQTKNLSYVPFYGFQKARLTVLTFKSLKRWKLFNQKCAVRMKL